MSGALCVLVGGGDEVRITVTPSSASGVGASSTVISGIVTAAASTGVPTAFEWFFVSGSGAAATNVAGASTQFLGSDMAPGETRTAVAACNVTVGGVVYRSPDVPVLLERF